MSADTGFLRTSPDLVWGSELGTYELRHPGPLVWSPGLMTLYGVSRTPASAEEFIALVHPEDRDKVQQWWRNCMPSMRADTRNFMGAAPTVSHAEQILRDGYQRQRLLAARHRAWCRPGTPLFPVCAPAWRQERLLAMPQ